MSPSVPNYAELVLQEAAAEAAQLKKTPAKSAADCITPAVVELNLKDEEKFPTLGQAVKKSSLSWGNSNDSNTSLRAPPPSLLQEAEPKATTSASSVISRAFQLPADQQRRSIASISLSECLEKVMKQTETMIEACTSGQTRAISFVIRGKADRVSLAKRIIWSELAQNGSIEFEVPEEALRFIIGPAGKTLQSIQSSLAVKINIPKGENWQGSIKVTGDFEGVALARDRILEIVAERVEKETVQVPIESSVARFLWMSSVSGLSEAALKSQFPDVKFSLHRSLTAASPSQLTLSGNRQQVASCKETISQAINRLQKSLKCASTPVPKLLHRLLCGAKAARLQELENSTNCAITVPAAESDSDVVSICAPEQFLMDGLAAVMNLAKSLDAKQATVSSEAVVQLFSRSAKYRTELKTIERESGASVIFSPETKTVSVEGTKESVMKASASLDRLLSDALARFPCFEHVSLDQAYIKHVIGRKGHVIQQIQKDFSVELTVGAEDGEVFVWGEGEAVSLVKAHISKLLAAVTDLVTCTAKIDQKYHALLIGAKGSNLAAYQERFPSVMVNFTEADSVEFRGRREEVEAFRAELVAQADAIRHEQIMNSYLQPVELSSLRSAKDRAHLQNFARLQGVKLLWSETGASLQGSKKAVDAAIPLIEREAALLADRDSCHFSVPSQFHSILIGKAGRNLKHLNTKYGVHVKFPASGTGDEIEIIGPKANLPKAREELLDLLKYQLEHGEEESFTVPAASLSRIVGRGGSKLTGIEMSYNCRISFTKAKSQRGGETDQVEFLIKGSKEGISSAKKEIEAIVAEQARVKEVSVNCADDLLSAYKFAFKPLTTTYAANCKFFFHSGRVNVRGECEAVDAAQLALEALVTRLATNYKTTAMPQIPAELFGKLLGSGGENVRRLSERHAVDIRIPRPGQAGVIQVAGPAEGVDAAVEEISLQLLKK